MTSVKTLSTGAESRLSDLDGRRRYRSEGVFVECQRAPYVFRPTTDLTPRANHVINATNGGQWVRSPIPHDSWLQQAAFTVDQTNGSDEAADPSAGNGLKTWDELRMRVGSGRQLLQATTITVPHGLPSTDVMIVDFGATDYTFGTGLTIVGVNGSTGVTGTVGTARNRNVTLPNDPNGITPTGGAFTWSTHVATNRVLVGVGGGIAGKVAHVVAPEGGSVGRVSTFVDRNLTEYAITAGDTYAIQTLQRVDRAIVRVPAGRVDIRGFVFTNAVDYGNAVGLSLPSFDQCSFEAIPKSAPGTGVNFVNCRCDGQFQWGPTGSSVSFFGGVVSALGNAGNGIQAHGGGPLYFQNGTLFQDTFFRASEGFKHADLGDVGFFGSSSYQPAGFCAIGSDRYGEVFFRGKVWGTVGGASAIFGDRSAKFSFASGGSFTLVGTDPTKTFAFASGETYGWGEATGGNGIYGIGGTEASIAGPFT